MTWVLLALGSVQGPSLTPGSLLDSERLRAVSQRRALEHLAECSQASWANFSAVLELQKKGFDPAAVPRCSESNWAIRSMIRLQQVNRGIRKERKYQCMMEL